ncbi:MAG: glycerol-3-phosphate 1-O-acyltransferase PlsY [Sedimentisphaerales bacterium]|nr:glycerol-3-phosphate 1-O-acyltransferase PlsY [Sedimentisphaerales bacterium]
MTFKFIVLILFAYFLGSVPFGLIIAGAYGKDLRKIGSGNIGATNLSRAVGKNWGYFGFFLDVLKGLVPMLLAGLLFGSQMSVTELFLALAVGCAAVMGHIFPVYIGFRGGKGVATSFGVALGLWPYYTICALAAIVVWMIVVLIWRYISLASIAASVAFPVVLALLIAARPNWEFANLWPLVIVSIAMPILVIVRHKPNIKRLISGTESKVLFGKTGK